MTAGQKVHTKQLGNGTIVSVDGTIAMVDFNGSIKKIYAPILKNGHVAPKVLPKKESNEGRKVSDIFYEIKRGKQERGFGWNDGINDKGVNVWNRIMEVADEKGHFAGEVVFKAINGGFVSEKQAWAVAYFAKENGII